MIKPTLKVRTNSIIYNYKGFGLPVSIVDDISEQAISWRRSTRGMGGYWEGSFTLTQDLTDVWEVYNSWLGYIVEENVWGVCTWEGQIVEIDFSQHGMTRRRSLNNMRNSIKVNYLDDEGEQQLTAAGTNSASISRFGTYEAVITADGLTVTAATALRDTQLKLWSWPYNNFVGASVGELGADSRKAMVHVTVAGLIHTGNRKFCTTGDGTADNVSDWIEEILISNDCEFLGPGLITANTLQVYKESSQPRRCWDLMKSLVDLGDASNDPYRLYVTHHGRVNYEPIGTETQYYIRDGVVYDSMGSLTDNPWSVQPGIMRDDSSSTWVLGESGGWLDNPRKFYGSEVDVGVDSGLKIKCEYYDEGELLIARLNYLYRDRPRE